MISRPFLSDGSATAGALFVVSEIAVLLVQEGTALGSIRVPSLSYIHNSTV